MELVKVFQVLTLHVDFSKDSSSFNLVHFPVEKHKWDGRTEACLFQSARSDPMLTVNEVNRSEILARLVIHVLARSCQKRNCLKVDLKMFASCRPSNGHRLFLR